MACFIKGIILITSEHSRHIFVNENVEAGDMTGDYFNGAFHFAYLLKRLFKGALFVANERSPRALIGKTTKKSA